MPYGIDSFDAADHPMVCCSEAVSGADVRNAGRSLRYGRFRYFRCVVCGVCAAYPAAEAGLR